MPARSSGCYLCRRRKIRCDEARPGCQRCVTHGVPCPGYRTPAPGQIAFEDQTTLTMRRALEKAHKSGTTTTTISFANQRPPHQPPMVEFKFHDPATTAAAEAKEAELNRPDYDFQEPLMTVGFAHPLMYASTTPSLLYSPGLERMQLHSSFLDYYLPKHITRSDYSYNLVQHAVRLAPSSSALAHCLDALSLVQVGSIHKDARLLQQASAAYGRSLGLVARELGRPSALADDQLLAALSLLAMCEFYDELAQMRGGWTKHLKGIEQLMCARGPDSITGELALLMYSDARHGMLSHSMISRKACFLARPEWRAVAARLPASDRANGFYAVALQVSTLLERFDALMASNPADLAQIDELLAFAAALERGLRAHLNAIDQNKVGLFRLVDISEFPAFMALCGGDSAESRATVGEAYMFPNFSVGYFVSVTNNVMFYLRSTVQELHLARHAADPHWFPEESAVVTEPEIMGYILTICRCLPFFVEPISAATGQIGLFLPLRTIALYGITHGHWHLLKWSARLRERAFVKGMSPPAFGDAGLVGAGLNLQLQPVSGGAAAVPGQQQHQSPTNASPISSSLAASSATSGSSASSSPPLPRKVVGKPQPGATTAYFACLNLEVII